MNRTGYRVRDAVAAYQVEHPKASAPWIAAALKIELWRVESALAGMAKRAAKTIPRISQREGDLLHPRILAFVAERGETWSREVGKALDIERVQAANQLSRLQGLGKLTSRTVHVEATKIKPPERRRLYKLAESGERAA
jgi:hypothetical protein